MFFILSKTAALLALPSNLLVLLGLIGLGLMATRFKRSGRALAIVSLLLLLIAGYSPLGTLMIHKLESRFPPWDASRGAPDGIIVLGGSISAALSRDYGQVMVMGDAGRVTALAKLARDYPQARIVYSGGDASLSGNKLPEAEFVGPLLDAFGIPRERVLLENRSRNTAENAAYTKALVQPKPGERWLLVTSASHMPRAIGCFRHTGFVVEAYPAVWRTRRHPGLLPSPAFSNGLGLFDLAVHEWTGLFMYWATGRIDEIFPASTTP
jgi:uncharacterized SAM-binding protein YcdF (DUF218 family)